MNLQELLEPVAGAADVLGALVVSREDGLLVAGSMHSPVNGAAIAALAASFARRAVALCQAIGRDEPLVMELAGSAGTLVAVPARTGLLLVAVTGRDADPGPARRELLRLADRVE